MEDRILHPLKGSQVIRKSVHTGLVTPEQIRMWEKFMQWICVFRKFYRTGGKSHLILCVWWWDSSGRIYMESGTGGVFTAPEVILVYSGKVLERWQDLPWSCIGITWFRSPYLHRERPIWLTTEATYFEFDDKKLLDIARRSVQTRIEMLVMDDGGSEKKQMIALETG